MVEEKPVFSIITPVYNVERFLPSCIESLINQTDPSLEIILVDDGSPDNCPTICDAYKAKDSRITVIHKENGGLVSARQAGIRRATGEYIICVDGDDWLELDYCEKFHNIIEKWKPDVICCHYYNCFPERKVIAPMPNRRLGYYTRIQIEDEVLPHLFQDKEGKQFGLSVWAKAVKNEIMRKYQLLVREDINIGEDIACMGPCIFNAASLYIMDIPLYNYRQNPESMTKSGKVFEWKGPEIRGKHLESVINVNYGDMRDQLYRATVHSLFNVVKSQFNRSDCSYKEIKNDILNNLSCEYYTEAIQKAKFRGIKANIMKYLLKYRLLKIIHFINMH